MRESYNDFEYERYDITKEDLQPAKLEDFFYWMNERHWIYVRRFIEKKKKPWTKDKPMLEYKFTNVFRQLDTGTIVLDKMLDKWFMSNMPFKDMDVDDAIDVLFNIIWYRMFNVAEHAKNLGFVKHQKHDKVRQYLISKRDAEEKVFTGVHMLSGAGSLISLHGKIYAHLLAAIEIAEDIGEQFISFIYNHQSLQAVCQKLTALPLIGKFLAYEMVCDLRFTPLLCDAVDKLTWANIGNGAERGLQRLGLPINIESLKFLYEETKKYIGDHVKKHFNEIYPPFELREIEHSLCEFDKHQRILTGAGRSRSKYNGYGDNKL